jgi:diaminopimelate epimerase
MSIQFHKYHGAGNDFVIIDDREGQIEEDPTKIAGWCNRRFGIGADGLILVRDHSDADFEMRYFNADGNIGSMCGNGGRCFARFLQDQGLIENEVSFMAFDGVHRAMIDGDQVSLTMQDVATIRSNEDHYLLDTGSPHYVRFGQDVDSLEVEALGREIRYSPAHEAEGINVNFVQLNEDGSAEMRTYERGVEAETLACGTGVVAAAIATYVHTNGSMGKQVQVKARGGDLKVTFDEVHPFTGIVLQGPAEKVYSGTI